MTVSRLEEKVALVTGGAGNIGSAISRLLARERANVWILDIEEQRGKDLVRGIEGSGGSATFVSVDVTRPTDIDAAVSDVLKSEGHIDVLVNTVGGSSGVTLDDVSEEVFQRNVDLNLKSALFTTKAVCPMMKREGEGSVIFISSVNALMGGFSEVAYASLKAGLHSLVRTLTADLSPDGIRFNALAVGSVPGDSRTWTERERTTPGILENLARLYPLRRVGDPMDVAHAVLFLASDESSWITGTVLPVDGGISATGALPGGRWWTDLPQFQEPEEG